MKINIKKPRRYPGLILKIIDALEPEEFGVFQREFGLFTTSSLCLSIAFANKHYADNAIRLSVSAYQKGISKHFLDLRLTKVVGRKFIADKEFREKIIKLHTYFGNEVLKLFSEIDSAKTITPSLVENLSLNIGKFFAHNMPIQTGVDYVAKADEESYDVLSRQRKKFEKPLIGQIEFYVNKICQKLAEEKKVSPNLLKYLMPEEMIDFINSNKLPEDLAKREKLWVLIRWPKPIFLTGKPAFNLLQRLEKREIELNKKLEESEALTGVSASPGLVQGEVQVIKTFKELGNFKEGNILVASAISPKYYDVIMKGVKGIIMDEGGLLSHAAILSREFKIPCVINTKIATKKLKTGQIVELDATNGAIKIIKEPNL